MASIWARYLAEFIGTYILVIVLACNDVVGEASNLFSAQANVAQIPLYAAGAVTALTYSLYNVSGAHLNPAVSVAFGIAGEMTWKMVGIYLALQFLAALLGTFTFAVIFQVTLHNSKSGDYDWAQAGLTEVLFSTMFCFVFLNAAASKKNKDSQHYGLAVGLALLAAACAGGHINDSFLNPAVHLGWATAGMYRHSGSPAGVVFILLDFIGAVIAAAMFQVCHSGEKAPAVARRALAEGVGTFYLVLVVGLSTAPGATVAAAGRVVQSMIALCAVLASMIFALADVSGAHFNPAVTIAVMTSAVGRRSAAHVPGTEMDCPIYIAVQLAAGVLGAAVCSFVEHGHTAPLPWGQEFAWLAIAIAEGLFTMLLVFVVLSMSADPVGQEEDGMPLTMEGNDRSYDGAAAATSELGSCARGAPESQEYAGLAVGMAAVTGGVAVGGISGGLLNPALAAGIAFTRGGQDQLAQCCTYAGSQLAGGVLAAGLFHVLRPPRRPGKAT